MESALADGRYEEAAHLRDEYRKVVQQSQTADRKL
jgi:protein-arginine kinase activator protein McsA